MEHVEEIAVQRTSYRLCMVELQRGRIECIPCEHKSYRLCMVELQPL